MAKIPIGIACKRPGFFAKLVLAPSELSIQVPFLGIGTIGNVMLVNKRVNTSDTYDGLFNYLWILTIITYSIAQPPSIASEYY